MKNIRFEFWKQQKESLGVGSSECAEYSGIYIPRKRLPGKGKKIEENHILSCLSKHQPNLEDEIHLKGGRMCNTLKIPFFQIGQFDLINCCEQ